MKRIRGIALIGVLGTTTALLTGCSMDTLIWGAEGARVIETTETLIDDVADSGTSEILCDDSVAELGEANDWAQLSAGEPERFVPEFWEDQVALDPQWSINLEGLPPGAQPGDEIPGDVFYRETDSGLCVIDMIWPTLDDVG